MYFLAFIKSWVTALTAAKPPEVTVPIPPKLPETPQQMVLRVCREECLTPQQTNDLYNTLRIESNFKNTATHKNLVGGVLSSTDWGLCQINDYFHIGKGKDFPSVEYVLQNPDKVVRWMCAMCKAGKLKLWVAYSAGLYKHGYVTVVPLS